MGLGISLVLTAAGAILAWAVNVHISGVDIHTVGVILFVVGVIGALLSLVFWSSWGGPGYLAHRHTYDTSGGVTDEREIRR